MHCIMDRRESNICYTVDSVAKYYRAVAQIVQADRPSTKKYENTQTRRRLRTTTKQTATRILKVQMMSTPAVDPS